jgi:hemerythrin superfamily protein
MLFSSKTAAPVLDMLREDHRKVEALFDEFESARDARTKQRIVDTALQELEAHAKVEESLVYPAIRKELEDEEDLMDEALEEHHIVHVLIRELKRMKPSDERYDAKFTVLGESVKHHVKEEESEMFPKAEDVEIDWERLEEQVRRRKEQLRSRPSGSSSNGRRPAAQRKRTKVRR